VVGPYRDVLRCAAATGTSPLSIADGIVRALIRRANSARALIRRTKAVVGVYFSSRWAMG
jgi:hypothetical protein